MRIDVYLDESLEPVETIVPPRSFCLDTRILSDGPHNLRFVATDEDGVSAERRMTVNVQNGPAIAVHGIADGDFVKGEVGVLANAYGAKDGDAFDGSRIETPAPIPTWAWILFLCVFAWGAGYVALDLSERNALPLPMETTAGPGRAAAAEPEWAELGERVYGNTCASCHRATGDGLAGVFPPLVDNPAVRDPDPTSHISAIIDGVSGKVIDGVAYPGPMPAFGHILSDQEIAAVVNHERSRWGNDSPLVSAADVAKLRR